MEMRVSSLRGVTPLLLAGVLLTRCSCDFFGTTGKLLISEDDEARLGAEFDRHLRDSAQAEFPLFKADTPQKLAFETYVKSLAQEILAGVPAKQRPDYAFTFTLIDKDVENAFAVPGGYVYFYTGIIKKMQDESELAGVMGHEIAHVTQHHYRDAVAKGATFSLVLQALLGNDAGALAQTVAGSFFQLAQLKVSRGNEEEADKFGTRYAAAVKRNPMGIAKYFARAQASGLPDWLSTHPGSDNRVADVTKQVNSEPALKAVAADSAVTNYQSRFKANTQVIGKTNTQAIR